MEVSNQLDSHKIPRLEPLERLRNLKHKKLIKIVTGIRRCGKSTVLEMFRDELLSEGVNKDQI
ncbi:MAG: AAA family ATPase, partial [Treponema sp.]|nr:AAA family ATPase [Treponema sp.]